MTLWNITKLLNGDCAVWPYHELCIWWIWLFINVFDLKRHYSSFCAKFIKWDFFHRLSVFLLHRWKYKLSENNTILMLKITVLSQILIIFCCLVNKYCCLLLSLSWPICKENVNITSMVYNRKNVHVKTKKYSARKRLKEREI